MMKLLLIVGAANDIFIYNYAKWLKKSIDVSIDVFEFYPSKKQGYSYEYYDKVVSAKKCKIPIVKRYVDSYIKGKSLKDYIKGEQYDIIHCHWIPSPLVLVRGLKKHCCKLAVTFWGREYDNMKLIGSNWLYRKHFNLFFKDVDAVINSPASVKLKKKQKITNFKGEFLEAVLGSAPLEALYKLMEEESRDCSKSILGMPVNKLTVLIGYSGKAIHQHLQILDELTKHDELKKKLHLIATMTRGSNEEYLEKVRLSLEKSGYSFTLLSGRFLSDKELAQVRNSTDITLQLSTSDGLSRSIIECLCAKSIMIYGDWLGYEKRLVLEGFKGICVKDIRDGIYKISEVINNLTIYDQMLADNYLNGKEKYIWSECIKDWVNAYKNLLSK